MTLFWSVAMVVSAAVFATLSFSRLLFSSAILFSPFFRSARTRIRSALEHVNQCFVLSYAVFSRLARLFRGHKFLFYVP